MALLFYGAVSPTLMVATDTISLTTKGFTDIQKIADATLQEVHDDERFTQDYLLPNRLFSL
jgi:hypothetical protein